MASKQLKSFFFRFFRVLCGHFVRISFVLVLNDFFPAFIEVNVGENQVLNKVKNERARII